MLALWLMSEVALIGADIQELHPSIPRKLWCREVGSIFCFSYSDNGILIHMDVGKAKPSGKELLIGLLVPKLSSKTINQAVGIVGCVIMPHNVFLHSALVQSRAIDPNKKSHVQEALRYYTIESTAALIISFFINLFVATVFSKGFYGTEEADLIGLVNAGNYLQEKYGEGCSLFFAFGELVY